VNWHQLKTVLWLRWRLTRNQWAKGGGIGAAIAAIVAFSVSILSVGLLAGSTAVGLLALDDAAPRVVMVVWLMTTVAFLFMWLLGLITELQRSETIDLQRLMHLPVQLGQIFVVNYAASHLAVSVLLFVPSALGLAIGLSISRGPLWLLMLPLAFGMVFMVTAWTYCLRGWLATLMSNPRRRRVVVMGLSAALILVVQVPNIYFNVINRGDRDEAPAGETREQRSERRARETEENFAVLKWQPALPPLWVPVGAQALAEGRVLPALLGTFGVLVIGGLGLRRAYGSTLRFYQGSTGGRASAGASAATSPSAARAPATPVKAGPALVDRSLPGVPDQAAAVALAAFQSMLRAPEIKMQWGTSFLITLFIGGSLLFRSSGDLPAWAGPFMATGVVVFSMFLMIGFAANQFGFDRDGFRAIVLAPVDRWQVLLGKNLAALPPAAASATVLLIVLSIWIGLPPLVVIASFLQLSVGLCLTMVAGNVMSILVPYRIQPGSMKPTKMPALAMVVMILSQMSLPIALTPTFLPPLAGYLSGRYGGPDPSLVNVLLSIALGAGMASIYWWSLGPLGRLLHRRETRILATVSVDVE
jgi:ABC-2 type transport system permease protein